MKRADGRFFQLGAGHAELVVRLTPKGGRDALEGAGMLADGSEVLLARVRAAPEDGAANAALIRLLAEELEMPRSGLRLVGGAKQRQKRIRVEGEPAELARRLERIGSGGRQ